MKATLEAINQMQADGVIGKYAIGGAVGATFYLAPAATVDVDVFVAFPAAGSSLLSLAPIYEYLKARGATELDDYLVVGDWPVQFLPLADSLDEEAVEQSVSVIVEGISTRVMTAEHLIAIALRTGRSKDHSRILQFIEQRAVDRSRLQAIIERHGLASKWNEFERRYLGGTRE